MHTIAAFDLPQNWELKVTAFTTTVCGLRRGETHLLHVGLLLATIKPITVVFCIFSSAEQRTVLVGMFVSSD